MTNNSTSENSFSSNMNNDIDIDIGKIFRFLLMQSKLIISVVLIFFAISYAYYITATKQYRVISLIEYEAFDQNILDPSQALQFTTGNSATPASNMIQLYESRTNYLKVIKDLKLNIDINGLEDGEQIDINITSDENDFLETNKFNFSFTDNSYSLLDDDLNQIQTAEYGQEMTYGGLKILVKSSTFNEYRPIVVHYRNPESMYNSFKSAMDVNFTGTTTNSFFMNEGLITISYVTDDTSKGKEIIDYANSIFLNQRIYDESEKSRKAISFIEENLKSIEESVESNKIKLKQFREENKSIDVGLEIQAIINKIQSLDASLSSIDIEIAKAREIYTPNNPAYLNLISKKALLEMQKEEVLSEIEMMPKEQQEYIDLFNELEVSQDLYEQLESRRLGFSILEASTIGDVRVVDEAYVDYLVSPRIIIVLLSTLVAFLSACAFAIIRGFYFLPISNPAEIFDNNINVPIIGVVPDINSFESDTDSLKLNTAIESLIVNINSIRKNSEQNKNIITITSPSAGNGKSTVSMKLAEGLSQIGKKVLLVDNDLKRGNLAKNYNVKSISEKTFNLIDESTIGQYQVKDNLFLIPRVKGLSNTFQFLYGMMYIEKINFFREHFDFVIFDTGPILAVADTSMLVEKSDFNILVTRHGINKVNEIKQCLESYKQINKNIDGLIYNAYAKPRGYYGYYSLYGNYSYQYYADKYLDDAYEYEKKD